MEKAALVTLTLQELIIYQEPFLKGLGSLFAALA
jgi:hypothetical protein